MRFQAIEYLLKAASFISTVFALSFFPGRAEALTEYYVSNEGSDSNPGSSAMPWQTIQKAASSAAAGATVYVLPGIYREKIAVNVEGSSEEGYITFISLEEHGAVISGEGVPNNPASYSDDILYIESKSYLKIIGFEIRDVTTPEGSGIRLTGGGSHVELLRNKIHEIRGGGEKGGAMGITVYGTNDRLPYSHIVIEGNEIYDCDPAYSEALTLNGNVQFFKVIGNNVHDVNNIGIDFIGGESWISKRHARNGLCKGNTVYRCRSKAEGGYAAGIYVDGGSSIILEKNEVYWCDLGIEIGAENGGTVTKNIKVRNNFIHDNDKVGLVFGGYNSSVGRVKNCQFTNNILLHNDTLSTGFGEVWVQYASNNKFSRNYIDPGEQNLIIASWEGNEENSFDYDNICSDSGIEKVHFIWNGVPYEGLKSFQEGTGQERHARVCGTEMVPTDL